MMVMFLGATRRPLPSFPAGSNPPVPFFPAHVHVVHFLLRLLDVILLVNIKSPMYFCRNRLWLSSLSCSSLTASIRLKRVTRESCSALACLLRSGQFGCSVFLVLALGCSLRARGEVRSACSDSPLQLGPRLLAEGLDVFARSSRAHGPHVVGADVQVDRPDVC